MSSWTRSGRGSRSSSADPCAAGSANYNYDAFGRLDTVTSSDKLVERYGYDGFDRVVSHRKYDPGTGVLKSGQTTAFDRLDQTTQESTQVGTGTAKTTTFTHLGMSDQIISEEQPDAGGAVKTTATYTYGPGGERISQTKSPLAGGASETSYYGVNPHTDVETLTSESGNTRSTYRYTGYGENDGAGFSGKDKATATGGPEVEADNPYRFNSKRWDPATGGYDMGFRDYSPGLNRFLTRDMDNGALSDLRLGSDPWTGNRYAFAGGNPITGIDYDGHCPMADEGGCDTNANYEIYVPPAASDTGGTETGEGPGESPNDWRRSHPSAGGDISVNTEALGNVLKAVGTMGLGAVVAAAGGPLVGGGLVSCGTGVLCPAGAVAVAGGVAISATGAAITTAGAQRFGNDFGRLFTESKGSGSSQGSDLFPNQMPGALSGEITTAARLGAKPVSPGSSGFDDAIGSGTVKWAVLQDGSLVVIPKSVSGQEIFHSVLSGGRPVRAAGEADIAGSNGSYYGLGVNNHSGHFKPTDASLQIGIDAFRSFGIGFKQCSGEICLLTNRTCEIGFSPRSPKMNHGQIGGFPS